MFDMLSSMPVGGSRASAAGLGLEGATVVDLFAGSGAIGIEALSRGAAKVVLVESDPGALRAVRANLAAVSELAGRAQVCRSDALTWARRAGGLAERWDLVVADPPYAWNRWAELLDALAPIAGLVLAETGSPWEAPPTWDTVRVRRYGSTVVSIVAAPRRDEPRRGGS